MNGDSYCAANLQSLIDFHTQRGAQATILVVEMPNIERFGCVRIDTTGAIIGFAEKSATSGPGWINAGVYVFSRSFLDELPDGAPLSLEYDVFPKWVCRGLYAHPTSEPFIDIGTPASYAIAQSFFARLIT
jgi:NDP-sugar pyrophosphorylase family protein